MKLITKIISYIVSYASLGFIIFLLARAIQHTLSKWFTENFYPKAFSLLFLIYYSNLVITNINNKTSLFYIYIFMNIHFQFIISLVAIIPLFIPFQVEYIDALDFDNDSLEQSIHRI